MIEHRTNTFNHQNDLREAHISLQENNVMNHLIWKQLANLKDGLIQGFKIKAFFNVNKVFH